MPIYDKFYIVKDKMGWSFGYVGLYSSAINPLAPYELFATIEPATWTVTFEKDESTLECESFEEIHDMLFEMMETDGKPRHVVIKMADGGQQAVPAPDLREQWAELGVLAKESFVGVSE